MGWSGRLPAPLASKAGMGLQLKEHEPSLKGIAIVAGLVGLVAGVAEITKQPEGVEGERVVKQLEPFPDDSLFPQLIDRRGRPSRSKDTRLSGEHSY